MWRRKRNSESFDESFLRLICEGAGNLVEKGMDPLEALETAAEIAGTSLEKIAPSVAATLVETAPKMLRDHRTMHSGFSRHIRKHWGFALDLYYMILVCAEELGREYDLRVSAGQDAQDDVFEVLTGLHARAIRTAAEIHVLLSAGFPRGALARCRTLHELAVTSIIVAESGRDPEFPDLARRFIDHQLIARAADAEIYQTNASILKMDPFTDAEIEGWRNERKTLLAKYGTEFKKDYGWAIPLFGSAPSFRSLEERAALDHLRGYYRWASHEVHSGSRGLDLNTIETLDGRLYRLTGRTDEGFAEPATMALTSLIQTMTFLITQGADGVPSPRDLLACKAVNILFNECGEAFSAADNAVTRAHELHAHRAAKTSTGLAANLRSHASRFAAHLRRR